MTNGNEMMKSPNNESKIDTANLLNFPTNLSRVFKINDIVEGSLNSKVEQTSG